MVTDYRYALYGTENQTEDLSSGEYYTDAGFENADGDDVVYIQVVEETYPEVVTEAEIPATEETYEYDVIVETVTTLPDTIYEEQTTVTTATRTKAGS